MLKTTAMAQQFADPAVKCALAQHWTHDTHLDQAANRLAICGHNVLLVCMHDAVALCTSQVVLGHVQVDLIAIKVGIEGVAVGVVHADGALALQAQDSVSLGRAVMGFDPQGSSVPECTWDDGACTRRTTWEKLPPCIVSAWSQLCPGRA